MTVLSLIAAASDGFFERALKWLIHFDYDLIGEKDYVEFRFLGMPRGWGLLLTILCLGGLVWLTVWLYRREGRTASPRRRYLLAGLRITAILLALLMFLEPTLLVSTVHRTLSPVLVLLDVSKSMTLADKYNDIDPGDDAADLDTGAYGPAENGKVASSLARQIIDATGWEPDRVRSQAVPREEILRAVLANEDIGLLDRLARTNPVHVYTFARSSKETLPLPLRKPSEEEGEEEENANPGFRLEALQPELRIQPDEPFHNKTHLGRAVKSALEDQAGRPVAAVVVVTDGEDNDDVVDEVRLAGEAAAARDVPVYGLLVGIDSLRKTKNIRCDDSLEVNRTVYVGDPVQIVARAASSGYEVPRNVHAELYRQKVGREAEVLLETKEFVVKPKTANQPLSFRYTPKPGEEGQYIFTVKVRPLADEHFKSDNISVASGVRVVKATTNVLLVSGSPSWEYRALRNLLIQDKNVVLWSWLQSASREYPQMGDRLLKELPTEFGPDPARSFGPKDGYHVIILMDINPTRAGMRREWFETIKRFVEEHAGGLLYVAGEKYTCDFFRTEISKPIARILPAELDLGQARVEQGSLKWHRENRLVPTPDGLVSPLLKFSVEPEENEHMWRMIPGHYWSFPVRRTKGAGTALIRTNDSRRVTRADGQKRPMPVFVKGYYGEGRVAFMAFDETWRWRQLGAQVYDTFWTQLIRSLVEGRLVGTRSFARLKTDGEQFDVGSPVAVSALIQFPKGGADQLPKEVHVEVKRVGDDPKSRTEMSEAVSAETLVLRPRFRLPGDGEPGSLEEGEPAEYRARYTPKGAGYYQLSVVGHGAGGSATTAFVQVKGDPEFKRLRANIARLQQLTEPSSGGATVGFDELAALPDRIVDRSEEVVVPGGEYSLWANPLALGLMALLLGSEWWLRKRANMA